MKTNKIKIISFTFLLCFSNILLPCGAKLDPNTAELHAQVEADSSVGIAAAIATGALVGAENLDGETPMHVAARLGNVAAMDALILADADRSARMGNGFRPAHLAIMHNQRTLFARLIIHHGGELGNVEIPGVGRRPGFTYTPFTLALQHRSHDVMAALMAHGHFTDSDIGELIALGIPIIDRPNGIETFLAIINFPGNRARIQAHTTAFGVPIGVGYLDAMQPLVDLHMTEQLIAAVRARDAGGVRAVIDGGHAANLRGAEGRAAIHVAARLGFMDIVNVLINYGGVEVDLLDGRGRTALHHAAIRNQNAMAVHLTTVHNANVNILDGDRALPRDLADRRQEEVNELLDILGAEEPPGEERINPLHLLGSVALTAAVGQAGGHGHGGGAAVGGGCL